MMKFLQNLGKSLMLPLSILPVCGILMGVGYQLCPAAMQGGEIAGALQTIGYMLVQTGGAVINSIPVLFALGVAVGMSDDKNGAAAIAGMVSWLIVTTLVSPETAAKVTAGFTEASAAGVAFDKIENPFIAILTGSLAATCYNRFKNTKLPDVLAFFSGRRFVFIVTALYSIVLSVVLFFAWPAVFSGLVKVGHGIVGLGGIGVGIYAFLNRMLIPLGLHHALNNVFWFDTIGIGDLTAYWAGKTSAEMGWSVGMYMSGFFAPTMFGIAGAALAMIKNAKNRKAAMGIVLSAAICAFICGITEPFEFAFLYTAFPLYVVYSILYGIFAVIAYYTGFRAGFAFSAGLTDLIFSATLPAAAKTLLILPLGLAAFVVFYLVFDGFIRKFNCITPGRGEDETEDSGAEFSFKNLFSVKKDGPAAPAASDSVSAADARSAASGQIDVSDPGIRQAKQIIQAIGGRENIQATDCCATRLRLTLADTALVDEAACKKAGALAVVIPDKNACQLIIGVTVQQVLDNVNTVLSQPDEAAEKAEEKADRPEKTSACMISESTRKEAKKEAEIPESTGSMKVLSGKKANGGEALGKLFVIGEQEEIGETFAEDIEAEIEKFKEAVSKVNDSFEKLIKKAQEGGDTAASGVLAAQQAMLSDAGLLEKAESLIREKKLSAASAAVSAGEEYEKKLKESDSEYIRERSSDVKAVMQKAALAALGKDDMGLPSEPSVIAAKELTPELLTRIGRENILGMISEQGSPVSHVAILSGTYGVPYVLGIPVSELEAGAAVLVNGEEAKVCLDPDDSARAQYEKYREEEAEAEAAAALQEGAVLPAKLYANAASLADVDSAVENGAGGIGLFRTEFLYMNRSTLPTEDEQFAIYKAAAEKMGGREVIIRTMDIGADKQTECIRQPKEENPALGKRAIRICLEDTELFHTQLRALLRAACFGDIKIMYPMITSEKELDEIEENVKAAAAELGARGEKYRIPDQGIMVETPAAAVISDRLAKRVKFMSIGTNDLTQYTLALDRLEEGLEKYYDPHHEALKRLIRMTCENGHKYGVTTGICGELGSDPEAIGWLIDCGVDELSVSTGKLKKTRQALAKLPAAVSAAASAATPATAQAAETSDNTAPESEYTEASAKSFLSSLGAPADGELIPMAEIPDRVFSQGIMGECIGIEPENGDIYAPADGTIALVAETLHAFGLQTEDGRGILVHVGIDTVELKGECFENHLVCGQQVKRGEKVMTADIDGIRKKGYSAMVITAITS